MDDKKVIKIIKDILHYYNDYIYEATGRYIIYKIRDIEIKIYLDFDDNVIFYLDKCSVYVITDISKLDKAIIESYIEQNSIMFREKQFNKLNDYMDEINVCPDDISE